MSSFSADIPSNQSEPSVAVYIVNFQDEDRKNRMIERFAKLDMIPNFVDPVYTSDERICNKSITDFEKKTWSVFFQHVDSIRDFVNYSEADYCIICEDDVYISKELKNKLPEVIELYNKAKLDIILLSYLWPYEIKNPGDAFFQVKESTENFELFTYPNDLWGAHMYMFSLKHARKMMQRFTSEFASKTDIPFCSDWHITKFGERGILVPMLGVEEGNVKTDHQGQIDFHRQCFEANYDAERFF